MGLPDYGAAMEKAEKDLSFNPPSLARVLGAIIYDSLALLALLMVTSFVFIRILGHPPDTTLQHTVFQLILFMVAYVFFCWFWTHGGQTIGMRAWKIKLMPQPGKTISWPTAGRRFFLAILSWLPLALGYVWILIGRKNLSWHDRLSKTYLVYLPGKAKQNKPNKI